MSAVFKIGTSEHPEPHRRVRSRKAEIAAARANLSRLDQAGDEVLDVVARRLWEAMGLDAEYERVRAQKQAGEAPLPRELGSFEVHVKAEATEALTDRSRLSTR